MDLYCGNRHIGPGEPCFVIAEVGLAHDGSLSQAHAYIDACASSGVDACKFQCHRGDPVTEWRVEPTWGWSTRRDYWERTGFNDSQWGGLAKHCADAGVEFLCSVFSLEALAVIDPWVKMHKIPSGRIADKALLRAVRGTGKPALLSTGMATSDEIQSAKISLQNTTWGVLQCTSAYPCPPERLGLWELIEEYPGLSDHSGSIYPGIAAAALGAQVLEVHVCFSKQQGHLDAAASLTIPELRTLVEGVRFVEKAMQPVDKDKLAEQLAGTRRVFMGVA